ncbi:hypothetical protein AXF41_12180 [Clostridium haemolyticum]|nr:hypothetical protein [Clostridium haemolyticum]OOB76458.1 hypothetical protein AXF41_12180 [Clostridium haemolyticum]
MSVIDSIKHFTHRAGYAIKQGIKEDVEDWTGGPDNLIGHGASGANGAIRGGHAAYKAETTGLHFAKTTGRHVAGKVAKKAVAKGVADVVAGPLAWSTDIYHIGHGMCKGWREYGR